MIERGLASGYLAFLVCVFLSGVIIILGGHRLPSDQLRVQLAVTDAVTFRSSS